MNKLSLLLSVILLMVVYACDYAPACMPVYLSNSFIYPDYSGVTIPRNIASLSFRVGTEKKEVKTIFHTKDYSVTVKGKEVVVPTRKWKKLLRSGEKVQVDILVKERAKWEPFYSFLLHISADEIDPYITYRLIAPGYEVWNCMGIYQRSLSSFEESPVYENNTMSHFCVNCHTANKGNPEEFIFHQRPKPSGTILVKGGTVQKLNTCYSEKIPALVYPSWHPSGNYIAFSVNKTVQSIHSADANRIEVWDAYSDIVIVDIRNNTLITTPSLMSEESFETFPSFSPDGKTLYFCSARSMQLPDSLLRLKYDLCSIEVDMDNQIFGQRVDTVIKASEDDYSISFPRLSPDGRFLLYTWHKYGNFSIWHREADLKMYDLEKKHPVDIEIVNSSEAESYHSWSSNGRWIIFSSRRGDGLYTRPYIAHIDTNGIAGKPFLLPQKSSSYYLFQDRSYNIPEFMTGKIKNCRTRIEKVVEGRN